jgi:uncharacterized protein (TIGR02145 family)
MKHKNLMLFAVTLFYVGLTGLHAQTMKNIDGNVYKTVTIGTQVWMAENLKTTKYRNGDPILNISDSLSWPKSFNRGGYCSYRNDPNNASKFGLLYNFKAMTDKRNVCPAGWHIPSLDEIKILCNFLGGQKVAGIRVGEFPGGQEAGEKLKSASGWGLDRETNKPGNGTNTTGFNGEPFGFRSYTGWFGGLGYSCIWWISSGDSFMASCISKELIHNGFETQAGYYIRCIKDK